MIDKGQASRLPTESKGFVKSFCQAPQKNGKDDFLSPWTIHDNEGRLDLQFVPVLDRKDITDLGVLASRQHQVFGHFSGTVILDNGKKVKIQNKLGFAEKVFNKW